MLKITEVHPAQNAQGEYVVLQNVGLSTVSLRGWILSSERYLLGDAWSFRQAAYVFQDDVPIKPYVRVVLFSGSGESGWRDTTDGRQAYVIYWKQPERVWSFVQSVYLLMPAAKMKVVSPYLTPKYDELTLVESAIA